MTQQVESPFLMEKGWHEELRQEFEKPYMEDLQNFLKIEYEEGKTIYPSQENIFTAFSKTPFDDVKVVIIGQDPYHNPGQAHGLSFSVPEGVKTPPSLRNIYKELKEDLQIPIPSHGSLLSWAKQGVLLLNATLTVRKNEPKSHYDKGWEKFTDAVLQRLVEKKRGIVFLLWGRSAKEKCEHIASEDVHILTAPHPSPFSAYTGFMGCKHFSKTNELLEKEGKSPISWEL